MPSQLLWRPLDKENIQDPYPMYRRLRDESPVHHAQTGEWIISRYDDVKSVLKDPRVKVGNRLAWMQRSIQHLQNHDLDFQVIAEAISTFLLFLNPPHHSRIRKFVSSIWSDRDVEQLVANSVQQVINKLPYPSFDVVLDYGLQVPALTMSSILGIPTQQYRELQRMTQQLSKALDLYLTAADVVTIHTGARTFVDCIREIIHRQEYSSTGLVGKIIEANKLQSERLSENELISLFIFLFSAGVETSSSIIGTGIRNLLRTGEGNVKPTPSNWNDAMEELLRYDPPVQLLGRIANETLNVGGVTIPQGNTLTLCVGSANRDSDAFSSPDVLDLNRKPNRHIAFGAGVHYCMGDWLGKLQGRMSMEQLFNKFPKLRLDSEKQATWSRNLAIRSLSSLPVRCD